MAKIEEKMKGGKIVSFKFKACLGRDENKKQIFRCMTWTPPEGLTLAKSRKEAKKASVAWEEEVKREYLAERENAVERTTAGVETAERENYTFDGFVNNVWIPLYLRDGTHRPNTIEYYNGFLKIILPYFKGMLLDKITGLTVSKYLLWLRSEYKTPLGKPLAERTVKHHYSTLALIFNYAERQEIINKNPMKKVNSPKVSRKPVDALSQEEAGRFLSALAGCSLDFRCMLHLFITTGLRRGECVGLQWRDFDLDNKTVEVKRAVAYTPESGIVVADPKTPNSLRTIPLTASTVNILKDWQHETKKKHPKTDVDTAFVFASPENPNQPRLPDAITRRVSRFIKSSGLPDVSPHDLRHTCASLLLSSGADVKSIQEILGHADASTTLNFYVKSDMKQKRTATDRLEATLNL